MIFARLAQLADVALERVLALDGADIVEVFLGGAVVWQLVADQSEEGKGAIDGAGIDGAAFGGCGVGEGGGGVLPGSLRAVEVEEGEGWCEESEEEEDEVIWRQ